jgi:2-polyprenyl-6-methoxyphenol hydroxylase-like FAD-dependent oxidoreductase
MAKVVIVGAGPVGLYTAVRLARGGNQVVVVDRDGGPVAGQWQRRGVMQFRHPHFFRPAVGDAFRDGAPQLWDAVVAAGGIPVTPPGAPEFVTGLQCRRSTFETALRGVVAGEPGVTLETGRVGRVEVADGRVTGVEADGAALPADLVIVAAGRSGHLGDEFRPAADGGPCGFSYVSRMYRVLTDDDAAELAGAGVPLARMYDGYLVIVFPQDARTISTLIVRRSDDDDLAALRHPEVFDAATRAIPHLGRWTDPDRFAPITDVLPGGGLTNTYQGQARISGLYFVGDAVCTTNPAAGRGVSLGLRQAAELARLIGERGGDAAEQFDQWCGANIRPWYEDHVYWDATLLRRWRGEDIDVEARIPSDVVCAAADVDADIATAVFPYFAMLATPAVLNPMQERARAVLRTGWRPPIAEGPTRDELVDALDATLSPAR